MYLIAVVVLAAGCAKAELPEEDRDAQSTSPDVEVADDGGDVGRDVPGEPDGCQPRTCDDHCGEFDDDGCGSPLECPSCNGSVAIEPSDTQMVPVDGEVTLEAQVSASGDDTFVCGAEWSSRNPSVAGVDDGVVTGRAPGRTRIEAECAGDAAEVEVHVHDSGLEAELVGRDSLEAWFRADIGLDLSNSNVERWETLSVDDFAVSNESFQRLPRRVGSGIGGEPVVQFASDAELRSDESIELDEATIFIVAQNTESDHRGHLLSHCEGDAEAYVGFDGAADRIALFSEENDLDAAVELDQPLTDAAVLTLDVADTSVDAYLNGELSDGVDVSGHTEWHLNQIGALCSSEYLEADIAEVMIFGDLLTDDEREAVEGYLIERYGLD
ncbi:MAG: Ig-like domain-containing protein [Persicimonas sp.]